MSLEYLLDRTLFSPGQWAEIRRGDDEGVDILAYADTKFTEGQMHEIYLGLKDGLDVSIYADPVYSEAQMFCLRRGLHRDQNILPYYSPAKSPEEMKFLYDDQRRENAPPLWAELFPMSRGTAQHMLEAKAQVCPLLADGTMGPPLSDWRGLADHPGLFAAKRNDKQAAAAYRAYRGKRREEANLLTSDVDRFGIYQIPDGEAHLSLLFEPLERLEAYVLSVRRENYRLIYTGYLDPGDSLNRIFEAFNLRHPPGYRGRSLSISDVVLLHRDGKNEALYVDSYGFTGIPRFYGEPMRAWNDGRTAAYALDQGRHLTLRFNSKGGPDFFLDGPDFLAVDGGALESPVPVVEEARQEAASRLGLTEPMREVNYEEYERRARLANQEPTVTILWSESRGVHSGQTLSLHEADRLFRELDAQRRAEAGGRYYDKTKFEIEYMMCGTIETYQGRQDFGDGDGSLIDHIRGHFTYTRNDPYWQDRLAAKGLKGQANERCDYALDVFVPFLEQHVELAAKAEHIAGVYNDLPDPRGKDQPVANYCLAMLEHIKACRRELNTAERPEYPAQPELADFFKDPDMGADKERSKREIWHEARSLGMTPSEYAAQDYQPPGVSEESGHRKPPSQLPHRRISPPPEWPGAVKRPDFGQVFPSLSR